MLLVVLVYLASISGYLYGRKRENKVIQKGALVLFVLLTLLLAVYWYLYSRTPY